MDELASPSPADDPLCRPSSPLPEVITVAANGDILLDATFETSRSTLKATRKATLKSRPGQRDPPPPGPTLKPRIRLAYRVDLATLKRHSRYFTNLLGDTRFQEARAVTEQLDALRAAGEDPGEAAPERLPRASITDDDQATQSAGREKVFGDMLRILHGHDTTTKPVTILYVVTLAVLADRFACVGPVSRHVTTALKFRWPATPPTRLREDGLSGLGVAAEELVRQKVLVAWLLDQPLRLGAATRELIVYGSHRWSEEYLASDDEDAQHDAGADAAVARQEAVWWYLPDGLEEELHYRRQLLLRTLASIPSHFLHLYTMRTRGGLRQCKLGYDSSSACDSFQLGEMVKFFVSKNLLALTTFVPASSHPSAAIGLPATPGDFAAVDLNSILAALKQCTNYQVDRHHTNCGLRTRVTPVLDYVGAMLGASAVQISLTGWKRDRRSTSWTLQKEAEEEQEQVSKRNSLSSRPSGKKKEFVVNGSGDDDKDDRYVAMDNTSGKTRVFRFTRAVASDQRLRYEGAMAADRMARELFTSDAWDWTADDPGGPAQADASRQMSMPMRRKLEWQP